MTEHSFIKIGQRFIINHSDLINYSLGLRINYGKLFPE
jgi:hypothetical protein